MITSFFSLSVCVCMFVCLLLILCAMSGVLLSEIDVLELEKRIFPLKTEKVDSAHQPVSRLVGRSLSISLSPLRGEKRWKRKKESYGTRDAWSWRWWCVCSFVDNTCTHVHMHRRRGGRKNACIHVARDTHAHTHAHRKWKERGNWPVGRMTIWLYSGRPSLVDG